MKNVLVYRFLFLYVNFVHFIKWNQDLFAFYFKYNYKYFKKTK